DFVDSDSGWLTDKHTRFLFLLDGFDELLLEGRESGGLKDFLQQIEQFQKDSHHRFLITGRPLSVQGIERVITQSEDLKRAELQPMHDGLRNMWHQKWSVMFGQTESDSFQEFLSVCPIDINNKLAREPLLLYLLGRMHREQRLKSEMFEGIQGPVAKLVIYDEAVRWVIEEQRQDQNVRLAGLESEDLRQALTEAAVCVTQSDQKVSKISFLEARLAHDKDNSIYELLQNARKNVKISEQKLLNNLLTAFYIKPASGDKEGSVEFAHKSFGEFLFAERLKDAMEDWSQEGKRRGEKYLVSPDTMHREIYDLLGYGSLTSEVMDYLMAMLFRSDNFEVLILFERLYNFYLRWCNGDFINAVETNWPRLKMTSLRAQIPDRKKPLGLQQINTYTGLNVILLLLELQRYSQKPDYLQDTLIFWPCGEPGTEELSSAQLRSIIGISECLHTNAFREIVGSFLSNSQLSGADLSNVDLSGVDLSGADLSGAYLSNANLSDADLSNADLSDADLRGVLFINANLNRANLSNASLSNANLNRADLRDSNLGNANLRGASLKSTSLNNANFSGTDIIDADLSNASLSRANLTDADLSNTDLRGASLNNADLSNANLRGAALIDTNLSRASLSRTSLSGAYLNNADLSLTSLVDANLSLTSLSNANLSNAYLNNADLKGTELKDANLEGTDLSSAKYLTVDQLHGARLCRTLLPKSIDLDPNRDCSE
ncbi:pentapeptide repeat-containing protein, partial [Leptolyngbya cf. ectocarpi LEGE 11479]